MCATVLFQNAAKTSVLLHVRPVRGVVERSRKCHRDGQPLVRQNHIKPGQHTGVVDFGTETLGRQFCCYWSVSLRRDTLFPLVCS